MKLTQQKIRTLAAETNRKETDLNRNIDTLRKENDILVHNIQSAMYLSPYTSSFSKMLTPIADKDHQDVQVYKPTNVKG